MMRPVVVTVLACVSQIIYANCWQEAGMRYRVDPWLLYSIAKKESRLNPSAIGRNKDGSHDIGLMQINSKHLPELERYGVREADLFDPCTNINVGAWVLSWNIHRHGNNTFALGAYNAGARLGEKQAERRQRYSSSVLSIYEAEVARASAGR